MGWLYVLGRREGIEWVLERSRMAFMPHVDVTLLQVDDPIALYVTRGAFRNPTRDESQVVALARVSRLPERRSVTVGGMQCASVCDIEVEQQAPVRSGLPFRQLVPDLSFIKNKKSWGRALQKTLVRVPADDFRVIANAFERHITAARREKG